MPSLTVEDGSLFLRTTTEAVKRYIRGSIGSVARGRAVVDIDRHGRFVMLTLGNVEPRLVRALSFRTIPSGRHRTAVPRRLSAPQLKAILGACYEEIDAAWAGFEDDRRSDTVESKKPSRSDIRSLVPFFLAIGIQTAANPEALRLIRRDCLAPHPLDENRVVIDWAKPRAGGEVRRAQRRSFDRRRPYAAPNLIDRVAAITEPLVAEAQPSERDHLFLVRGNRPIGVGTIRYETLRIGIRRFIARANTRIAAWNNAHSDRPRAPLPNFAPVPSAAASRLSITTPRAAIRAAQAVLNHARADTTDLRPRTRDAALAGGDSRAPSAADGRVDHWRPVAERSSRRQLQDAHRSGQNADASATRAPIRWPARPALCPAACVLGSAPVSPPGPVGFHRRSSTSRAFYRQSATRMRAGLDRSEPLAAALRRATAS